MYSRLVARIKDTVYDDFESEDSDIRDCILSGVDRNEELCIRLIIFNRIRAAIPGTEIKLAMMDKMASPLRPLDNSIDEAMHFGVKQNITRRKGVRTDCIYGTSVQVGVETGLIDIEMYSDVSASLWGIINADSK